ncbi:MAG: hypothetical protein Q9169_005039 [Polycauliona sp. 2 TL-2023]
MRVGTESEGWLRLGEEERAHATAVVFPLSVESLTSPPLFPGPYAPSVLEERVPQPKDRNNYNSFNTSIRYLSHLHLQEVQNNQKAGASRPCNEARADQHRREEFHMSQGPPAPRPSSNQRQDDRYQKLPPLQSRTLPPINDSSRPRISGGHEIATPYAKTTPAQSPVLPKSSRPIGMQNILNPTGKESPEEQSRRRNADHFDLPSPATTAASRAPSISMTPSPGTVSLPSITPSSLHAYAPPVNQGPRPILTPRSASGYGSNLLHKAFPATIDAKASPFIGSNDPLNAHVPETGHIPEQHSVPPATSLPLGGPYPPARSPPGRRPSGGSQVSAALERRASLAGSDSPSTTYSSYSQYSQTPPVSQSMGPASQPSSAFFGIPYSSHGAMPPLPHGFGNNHGPVSSSSAAQSPYQMMTLDTDQGPIQVPVDVQAASKVADEKRKRNATASHRFRQRRKEKERETSQNIDKLESQIGQLAAEKDFYRQERDYFRSLVSRNPGQAHLTARPPSPRHIRAGAAAPQAGGGGGGKEGGPTSTSGGQWPQQSSDDGHNGQSGRNTRRRTSSYVPAAQEMPQLLNDRMPAQHQQQPPPQQQQHHGYPRLQPAKLRGDDGSLQHATGGHRQPSNNPPMWHPPRR